MDTKHRETIPNLVRGLPFSILSDDDGPSVLASMATSRKSKNRKFGKNGLHPGEDSSIARWWLSRDISNEACDTPEAREDYLRLVLLEQRYRETKLQIILILETLALEALPSCHRSSLGIGESIEDSKEKPRKRKRLQNLDTLLELLVDRMSIWQSMALEDTKPSGKRKIPNHQHNSMKDNAAAEAMHLQQFCIDVVIPL